MSSHLKKLFPTLTILVFQSRHFKLNYMLPCNLLNWKLTRSSLSRISISFNQTWKLRAWKLKFPIHFDWKFQFGWDSCEIYAFRRLWHFFVAENCESAFSSPNASFQKHASRLSACRIFRLEHMSEIHLWRCFADTCVFNDPWRLCGATTEWWKDSIANATPHGRDWNPKIGRLGMLLWGLWNLSLFSLGTLVSFWSVSLKVKSSKNPSNVKAAVDADLWPR